MYDQRSGVFLFPSNIGFFNILSLKILVYSRRLHDFPLPKTNSSKLQMTWHWSEKDSVIIFVWADFLHIIHLWCFQPHFCGDSMVQAQEQFEVRMARLEVRFLAGTAKSSFMRCGNPKTVCQSVNLNLFKAKFSEFGTLGDNPLSPNVSKCEVRIRFCFWFLFSCLKVVNWGWPLGGSLLGKTVKTFQERTCV